MKSLLLLSVGFFLFYSSWKPGHRFPFSPTTSEVCDTLPTIIDSKYENELIVCEFEDFEASINPTIWKKYLTSRLQRIFDSVSDRIPAGKYVALVEFVVEADGRITEVKAIKDPGFDLARFAEEVIRKSPRWTPSVRRGRNVRSRHTQPITFIIEENKKKQSATVRQTIEPSYSCSPVITEACIDSALWVNYIDQNVKKVADTINNRIPAGSYKVETLFLIEKNGTISEVRIPKACHPELDSIAMKMIQNAPAWQPSTRNGKFTRTYKTQTIIFNIPDPDCKNSLNRNSIL